MKRPFACILSIVQAIGRVCVEGAAFLFAVMKIEAPTALATITVMLIFAANASQFSASIMGKTDSVRNIKVMMKPEIEANFNQRGARIPYAPICRPLVRLWS